ncbi:MAG: TIGR02300 family protein [Alphaproteobacteria bacterium]
MSTATSPMGLKRICTSCGVRFYDMNKRPITCPSCDTEFTGEVKVKTRRGRAAAETPKKDTKIKAVAAEKDDDDIIEDDDDDGVEVVSLEDAEDKSKDDDDDDTILGDDDDLDDIPDVDVDIDDDDDTLLDDDDD